VVVKMVLLESGSLLLLRMNMFKVM